MPGSKFLTWNEIKDFHPGLWTQDPWNMPASAAQQMDDCLPDLGGGLRAAMTSTAISTAVLPTGAGISCVGTFIVGGQGNGAQSDRYVWLKNNTNVQVWGLAAGATNWLQLGADIPIGTGLGPQTVIADTFTDAGGTTYVVFNLWLTQSNDGLYTINRTTGAVVKQKAGGCTCCAVQDSRILAAFGGVLWWTDPQTLTFSAANNLPVQISRQNPNIIAMQAVAPSDLLLGMQLAPWVLVQGDITNPTVRGMSDARLPGGIMRIPDSDMGKLFVAANKGVFSTVNGSSFTDLSSQLAISNWNLVDLTYVTNFLATAKGNIYDERTKSWYHLTGFASAGMRLTSSSIADEILAVAYVANAPVIRSFNTTEASRATTYTWKSAPLRAVDGRLLRIREIQIYGQSFNTGSTVSVTINGVTVTKTWDPSKGQQVSYLFNQHQETLDITIVANSNGAAEAPLIEAVRVGSETTHRLH